MAIDLSKYQVAEASISDAGYLAEIMELSDKHLNPEASEVGLTEAEEILSGYIDGVLARKIINLNNGVIDAFVTVHSDASRKRIYADTWQRPGCNLESATIDITKELAVTISSEFQLWIGANSLDKKYIAALQASGFELLRTYWGLRAQVVPVAFPSLPDGFEIKLVREDAEFHDWWQVHQDSFSEHFGFAPREYSEWRNMVDKAVAVDPDARWVLHTNSRPVGFIECSNIKQELNCGYVDGLGVIKQFHGRGLGEFLLRWAFAYYATIGRTTIELNVDTGNESGALRLYEKLGMKPKHSWQQFENLNWSAIK